MSEIRFDPLTGRPVVVAENRLARPNEHAGTAAVPAVPADCPFCEGHEDRTPPELFAVRPAGAPPNGPGWTVRVIPNKFPSLSSDPAPAPGSGGGEFRSEPGFGYHEVLIEAPHHAPLFPDLPLAARRTVLRTARDRVAALAARARVRNVLLFENAGPESGGTLWHPHAQIVGTSVDLPRPTEELAAVRARSAQRRETCPIETIVAAERAAGTRWIGERDGLVAYAPYASELPFEVRLSPERHEASFAETTDAEVDALADLLPAVLRGIAREVPGASYNWFVSSPSDAHPDRARHHWQLTVAPRLVRPDGFELGGGMAVNPILPERAAERLRPHLVAPG